MENNVVAMAGFTPFNKAGVHIKDQILACSVAEAIRQYTSPVTGLVGTPTSADFRDPDAAAKLTSDILSDIEFHYAMDNSQRPKGQKWPIPQVLPNHVIADLLVRTGDLARMVSVDGKSARLLMRVRTGPDIGIHRAIDPDNPDPELMLMITNLRPSIAKRDISEVLSRIAADIRLQTYDPQSDADADNMLVWAANGIYNLRDSSFCAYDDPSFDGRYGHNISTFKLAVRYNPNATTMPVIKTPSGDDWTFDKQLMDTFDCPGCDPDVRDASIKAVWQMLAFAIRGRSMSGGYALWFTNAANGATGRNGKSTITAAVKAILGTRNVLSTPVEELNERFALARLPYVAAIVSDETNADVKAVEKAAVYKALVTGEAVMVDEKQKTAYSYAGFRGPMIQAMNGVVKLQMSGGSLWRRILVIRFERNFELLGENPLVKDQYLKDPAVLEAILYRAVHMPVVDRFTPDVVTALEPNKSDVRTESSKVWAYMDDVEGYLREWAGRRGKYANPKPFRIPLKMLYDCYRDRNGWSVKNGYSFPLSYPQFTTDFVGWVSEHMTEWKFYDKSVPTGIYGWIADTKYGVSPLLEEYPAEDWAHDGTFSGAANRRGMIKADRLPTNARGVLEYVGDYIETMDPEKPVAPDRVYYGN